MRPISMRERRTFSQPHYRQSAERDHLALIAATFIVGAMLGATLCLAAVTTGLVAL